MKPPTRCTISGCDPPEKVTFTKVCNISRPRAQNCKGLVAPGTKNFIEELIFYQSGIAEMVNVRKFGVGGPSENLTLLRGQIWG